MSIFLRIWLAFALVLVLGTYLTIKTLQEEIKPSVRQAIEDTLADNANIIAALVVDDVKTGQVDTPAFNEKVAAVLHRQLSAQIWQYQKDSVAQHIYITNAKGIVLFDSQGLAVGKDYSRWNDVRRTLDGKYGARTTRQDPQNELTSTMFVAAPIIDQQQIIGVVSVSKQSKLLQPFIERAQQQMLKQGLWVVALALVLSGIVAWWLRHGIYQVAEYARTLSTQRQTKLHFWAAKELNSLVDAIDKMRQELEGKNYIERYVHTLTHELKSPLTAIKASAEILQDELDEANRQRFSINILEQTDKLQQLIERLLLLARLEQQQQLSLQDVDLSELIKKLLQQKQSVISKNGIQIVNHLSEQLIVKGEIFWLEQAVSNILDNALDFTPNGQQILLHASQENSTLVLSIENQGQQIPDYALAQVFERYYSLPRPNSQKKSTGIGLTLVKEVMVLHGGSVSIDNYQDGVRVVLTFSNS